MQRGRSTITSARTLRAREHEQRAVARRLAGASYSAIGAELGISPQAAHKAVVAVLRRTAARLGESADELRQIEAARLDELLLAVWPAAQHGDLSAVDRALAIAARRAKLYGLDVPVRSEFTGANGTPLKMVDVASMIYLDATESEFTEVALAVEPKTLPSS